jgi:hypothetical protein
MLRVREVLSAAVPAKAARIVDLTVFFLFGLVTAKLSILNYPKSDYANKR